MGSGRTIAGFVLPAPVPRFDLTLPRFVRRTSCTASTLGVVLLVVGGVLQARPAAAACELHSRGGAITHVVHIQFDNLHLQRDNPNVPSDLEQMPHLLDFLASDGLVSANHEGSPLAQQASESIAILTGLNGDRTGVPAADVFGSFRGDGGAVFTSAFGYWTATGGDGKPLLLSDTGRTVPAPWVPFTRSGCDVGAVAMTGLALQEVSTDVANVFGAASPEAALADDEPVRAKAELLGVAIHCARGSPLCANTQARPDLLPDEPDGYAGFSALFGHRHVQPVVSPGTPVTDIDGNIIADASGNHGLPSPLELSAAQSLGYAATLLEAGAPIVYVGIGDAHSRHTGAEQRPWSPGEAGYVARLAAYDAAFQAFVDRLATGGMTRRNTLFVVVSTGHDAFIGGPSEPPDCNGIAIACSYRPIGRIDTSLNRLLASERRNVTAFDVVAGNAPAFFIRGNPAATDPLARVLAQDVSKLSVLNPVTGRTDRLAALLADRAALQLLHMLPASAARAPSFVMLGDLNYFNETTTESTDCASPPLCAAINPDFPWARDDVRPNAATSWFGMTGPGVADLGQTADLFSRHADLRPTMLALLGLTDSYAHDGAVLVKALDAGALSPELAFSRDAFVALARASRALNDPLGRLGRDSLVFATQAIKGTDTGYEQYLAAMQSVTSRRDALARQISAQLDGAAFAHRPIDPADARALIGRADALVADVEGMAGSSIGPTGRPWKAATGER
jgi:hypothetical protein